MKLRPKLFSLVGGALLLTVGSGAIYFSLLLPVNRIQEERVILSDLSDALRTLQIESNRLDSASFFQQRPRFENAVMMLDDAFSHFSEIKYLRKASLGISEDLEAIAQLQVMNKDNLASAGELYDQLEKDAKSLFGSSSAITFRNLYLAEHTSGPKETARTEALYDLSRFMNAIAILSDSLDASVSVLAKKAALVDTRVEALRLRALVSAAVAMSILAAVILAFSFLTANAIARSVISMAGGVARLRDGDLSVSFPSKGKDEIAGLSRGLDAFVVSLDEAVLGIKDAASRNGLARDRLEEAARLTGESLASMRALAADVVDQTRLLDERVLATKESVKSIAGGVGTLDDRISDQISMVEESTASITQIMATIGNTARMAEKDRELADGLVRVSDSGREVFEATFQRIDAINEKVGKIEEMIGIINSIAAQTNLLAMNAAIEAAHAGEAGRGFAVVADEIRKLAEASSRGSREIAASVKSIVDSIESARSGSRETSQAFGDIETNIRGVSRSVLEISSSLAETDAGSRQILTAMTALRELSASISSESRSVAAGARAIDDGMGDLEGVAARVKDAMSAISDRSSEIAETADRTSSLSRDLSSVGVDLEKRISIFRTRCEDSGGTIAQGGACEENGAGSGKTV